MTLPRNDTQFDMLANAAVTSNTTNTVVWDVSDGDYAQIVCTISAEAATTATNPTIGLQEGDDTNATSMATIVADTTVDATADRMVVFNVDLRGRKKYLKLLVTAPSGANNNIARYSSVGMLQRLKTGSADSTSSMVASTSEAQVVNV